MRTVFESVDEIMDQVVRPLDTSQPRSPFSDLVPDATPVQHRVIADYATRFRAAMTRALVEHGIARTEPRVSAVWAARTALVGASVAMEELKPQYLRGYGELPADQVAPLDRTVAELLDLVARMEGYLARGAAGDVRARLERLAPTLELAASLSELERVITDHGLTHFRPELEALVGRLESPRFEVALFGRVSSGKSSLLDYLLETDLLPVGVTPVTALPIRIEYCSEPRATIHFAESEPTAIDPRGLSEFATEQRNPGNRRHVTRIELGLPAAALKAGVTFVDTPGLGSLATSGAAESWAYLPRCDLGVVLVDASTTLTHEDLVVVSSLYQTGGEAMVLMSKADVLADPDRQRVVDYARTHLRQQVGTDVPVHLVSVRSPEDHLARNWVDGVFIPMLAEHRRLGERAVARKVQILRDRVKAALMRRIERRHRPGVGDHRLHETLVAALTDLDAAQHDHLDSYAMGPKVAREAIEEAARRVAGRWRADGQSSRAMASVVSEAIADRVAEVAGVAVRRIAEVRRRLMAALASASAVGGDLSEHEGGDQTEQALPQPTGLPPLDTGPLVDGLRLARPVLGFLGDGVLRLSARKQLDEGLAGLLESVLCRYLSQIDQWRSRTLAELRQAFTSRAESVQGLADPSLGAEVASDRGGAVTELKRDIAALDQLGGDERFNRDDSST